MNTVMVARAAAFAAEQHGNQVDKCKEPYVNHLRRVADAVAHNGFTYEVVAWLHDVVEDTDTTVDDIDHHFGFVVAGAVDRLSRRPFPAETHREYIERIIELVGPGPRGRLFAIRIKIADILDNIDPSRKTPEGFLPREYMGMLESRYLPALRKLTAEL